MKPGQFETGLKAARVVLADNEADGEGVYMAAVAHRYLKRFEEAAEHLSALHAVMPEYGRAWQEEDHLALAHGDERGALAAFTRATRFNAELFDRHKGGDAWKPFEPWLDPLKEALKGPL